MTSPKAILMGAALIAVSLLLINMTRPAEAQYAGGQFQLMHHSNPSSNTSVFRINNATGEVSYCYIPPNVTEVVCTRPTK